MHDLKTSNHLTKFVNEDLDAVERSWVGEHLLGCEDCAAWVKTYGFLSESIQFSARSVQGGQIRLAAAHPSSEDLANFALSPERLDPKAAARCSYHLETCAECQQVAALVQAAATEARSNGVPAPSPAPVMGARFSSAAALSPVAWAAALVLVVGAAMVGQAVLGVPESHQLTGSTLKGRQTIQAQDLIWVETTTVGSGAELILETGNMVAFGDGFSVASEGTLSVVVDPNYGS